MKLSEATLKAVRKYAKKKGITENEAADALIATAAKRHAAVERYAGKPKKKAKPRKAAKAKPRKKVAAKKPARKVAAKPRVRKPKAPKAAPVVDVTPEAEAAE